MRKTDLKTLTLPPLLLTMMTKKALVLAAAGSSSRMKSSGKKEYLSLNNGTVLSEALKVFLEAEKFNTVVVSFPKGKEKECSISLFLDSTIKDLLKDTLLIFSEGGKTRQESVYKSLQKVPSETDIVLIHDAARPFVSKKIIQDVIKKTKEYGAAVPGIKTVDTQKKINIDNTIECHLERETLVSIQTPQGFLFNEILACHRLASEKGLSFTDDSEAWDSFPSITKGKKVFVTEGSEENKKITFSSDLKKSEETRIGLGTDFHRLSEGRPLLLGGVEIPFEKGEEGHSDGDALLHAICDALLGASGKGDIGSFFPDTDPKWKDADSKKLLKKVWENVKEDGWKVENIDCVIELEKPKLLPFREKIIASIASILEVSSDRIFIKGKTNEGLGSVGKTDAVKTFCVCLLKK